MRFRRRILLLSVPLLLLVSVLAWYFLTPRIPEPIYAGKPLGQWLRTAPPVVISPSTPVLLGAAPAGNSNMIFLYQASAAVGGGTASNIVIVPRPANASGPIVVTNGTPVQFVTATTGQFTYNLGGVSIGGPYAPAVNFPKIDTNAIPYLVNALKARAGTLHRFYLRNWVRLPLALRKHLSNPWQAQQIRRNAAYLLGTLGAEATNAVPDLTRILQFDSNPDARLLAAECLGKIGRDDTARSRVAGDYGYHNTNVVAALVQAAADKDPLVRAAANDALWLADPEAASETSAARQKSAQ